ncbi:MC2R [Mytilus edulis]|uniref:MC2R n=1 Tax=Mytilus edulis TaxID=6550 RepID=A0A8S3T5B4_MYTED|nr:MC2R [Mytilus edulis]
MDDLLGINISLVITGIRIWKIFFSSRVQPVNIEMNPSGSSNHNEAQFSNQSTPKHGIRRLSSISIHYQDNYAENDTVPNFNEQQSKINSDVNYKHRHQVYSKSDEPSKRLPIISLGRIDKKAWEIRAFSTSVITVVSAIIFTGPFLVSYWMEILTDTVVARQTHVVLFYIHMLNLFVDPFIYVWRIPEIKEQLKKIIKC